MDKPIKPAFENGRKHSKKCICDRCDEYNYALIFWEDYIYNTYHVYDIGDDIILYTGTYEDCVKVQDESYAGLIVISVKDLQEKKETLK